MSRTDLGPASLAKALRRMAGDGGMEWCCEPIRASVLLDVADLLDENAKLRGEFRKMDEWHSKELVAAIDENAKLREMVWRLFEMERIGATSSEWHEIHEAACELGIEVDG